MLYNVVVVSAVRPTRISHNYIYISSHWSLPPPASEKCLNGRRAFEARSGMDERARKWKPVCHDHGQRSGPE